jgi:hypothetical protein
MSFLLRAAAFAAAVILASCALPTGQIIKEETNELVGRPLSEAIAKLGVPTEERTIADMKVYIWSTSTVFEGTQLSCQIRAIMKGNVIGTFDFEGNEGCRRYARQLLAEKCRTLVNSPLYLPHCSG